jgi:hypothetical protein
MIDRREALRRFGAATLASSLISLDADDLLAGLTEHGSHAAPIGLQRTTYRFQTLDAHQRKTIVVLAEMIIPTTETPGAKDAAIDEFADIILTEWSSDQEKKQWIDGLAAIDAESQKEFGKSFLDATAAQRLQLMTKWDAELTAARDARRAWRRDSGTAQPPDHRRLFFHQLRSFTVSGYYSSEVGYTKERKAVLIPGIYKACMPMSDA